MPIKMPTRWAKMPIWMRAGGGDKMVKDGHQDPSPPNKMVKDARQDGPTRWPKMPIKMGFKWPKMSIEMGANSMTMPILGHLEAHTGWSKMPMQMGGIPSRCASGAI